MTWLLGVRIVIALLALRRLGADALRVRRSELPVTRLFLPLLMLAVAILVANRIVPRPVAAAGLFAVDLLFLAVCFNIAASLRRSAPELHFTEERLQHVLERFFPNVFARYTSIELTVAAHAIAGVKAFLNPPRASHATYVHGSKVATIGVIMALSIVPDAVLLWILIPHAFWWLAPALDVLDVWACVWAFGIYGTMAARPHEFSEQQLIFHNGVFQRVRIDRSDVLRARTLGLVRRRQLPRRRGDGSRVLTLGGVPIVEIELSGGRKIFVASDAPQSLCDALSC